MARLFLLRHAKAAWPAPGLGDFERALDRTGRAQAAAMGAAMARRGFRPGLTICSTARRAAETWEGVLGGLGPLPAIETVHSARLYNTDARAYLDLLAEHGNGAEIMMVGHNPTIEDVAIAFSGKGDEDARTALQKGFPTCGLAVISLPDDGGKARPEDGRLELFLKPDEV